MSKDDIFKALPDKPHLRIGEVTHFFPVSPKAIYEWYNLGMLEGKKHKGVIKISRVSVIDFNRKKKERTGRDPL
jgi:hypothetical protein